MTRARDLARLLILGACGNMLSEIRHDEEDGSS
jgi:hypothetical protein